MPETTTTPPIEQHQPKPSRRPGRPRIHVSDAERKRIVRQRERELKDRAVATVTDVADRLTNLAAGASTEISAELQLLAATLRGTPPAAISAGLGHELLLTEELRSAATELDEERQALLHSFAKALQAADASQLDRIASRVTSIAAAVGVGMELSNVKV